MTIQYRQENSIQYLHFGTMMLDWDMADDSHYDKRCITIAHRCEAYKIMYDWVKEHPDYLFRVYETPGGVRAFVMSHDFTWNTNRGVVLSNRFMRYDMRCDELYIGLCLRQKAWSVRVSPKAGRDNDYVARHVRTIGKGNALPHHLVNVEEHDLQVSKWKGYKPPTNIMLCGLPGSGKSTYAKTFLDTGEYMLIDFDELRLELSNQEWEGQWEEAYNLITLKMEEAKNKELKVLYDGCNSTKYLRRLITKAQKAHWEVHWIDKDPQICIERQALRERKVPTSVIYKMADNFEMPSTIEPGIVKIVKL